MTTDLTWHTLGEPRGRGWPAAAMDRRYDRLPSHTRDRVPEAVWDLSRDSSGMFHDFVTDATELHARWRVRKPELALGHMPAIAASGLDLYAEDDAGVLRWAGSAAPGGTESEAILLADPAPGRRRLRLYLPLFNQLADVRLGAPAGADLALAPAPRQLPIVYYGTSIIHGIAASRAGMSLPAILGRRLGRDVIGLGFSGNGKMETALADLLAEVDAAVYVVDCLPNMDADLVRERAVPFLRTLRAARPHTPVLLVEDRSYTNAWIRPAQHQAHVVARRELRAAYESLRAAGDTATCLLAHTGLLGEDDEGTVDGSHPTDLGFMRMADRVAPVLADLLADPLPAGRHGRVASLPDPG